MIAEIARLGKVDVHRTFGGYNRIVKDVTILRTGERVIVKILDAKKGTRPLEELMAQVLQYHDALLQRGVKVVSIKDLFIANSPHQQLIEVEPLLGETAEKIMIESSNDALPHVLKTYLGDIVLPVFTASDSLDLPVGLDIGPRNAPSNHLGSFEYVDLVPPKITLQDGTKTLEYPEPTNSEVIAVGEFRHFHKVGLALQLLTQLCKRQPHRRLLFLECLTDFFNQNGEKDLLPFLQQSYSQKQIELLECKGEGYLRLRDAACETAYHDRHNPRTPQRLNHLFVLLHMQDQPVPPENVNQFKSEVLRWMDETEGE